MNKCVFLFFIGHAIILQTGYLADNCWSVIPQKEEMENYSEFGLANAALYLGVALILFLYVPFSLWFRSKKVLKTNEVLANTLHFEFEEETICVSKGEQIKDEYPELAALAKSQLDRNYVSMR